MASRGRRCPELRRRAQNCANTPRCSYPARSSIVLGVKARQLAGAPHVAAEVPPAEPEQRARFAEDSLRDRELEQRDEDLDRAPIPTSTDDGAPPRTFPELEQDATAIARCAFLVMLFARVRRGRAGRVEVADKRGRVDSRAQRVGARVGPRLAILGGALFWAGVAGEIGGEVVEEMIDRELDAQDERAAELEHQAQQQTRQDGQP